MNIFFYGYRERFKAFNELFVQASQNFIRINEHYTDLLKANESANALYKEYINHFQKVNQQWIQYFWSPFLTQAQVKETEKIREKMKV
jgi:biotin-(acetyl-CoA carboxylase) ligase